MLNWNPWFDMELWTSESRLLAAIDACEVELRERHGIGVEAYAVDDGYDDPARGFWIMDTNKFPDGLSGLRDRVLSAGSRLGLWLPPSGGYPYPSYYGVDQVLLRADRGAEAGSWREATTWPIALTTVVDRPLETPDQRPRRRLFQVGSRGNWGWSYPHYLALLRSAANCAHSPRTFTSTLPAARGPRRSGCGMWIRSGAGNRRGVGRCRRCAESWISYRDADTYQHLVRGSPLHPLNSVMLHGIQHGTHGYGYMVAAAGDDLRREARTFFGSGTQLQELYVSPAS